VKHYWLIAYDHATENLGMTSDEAAEWAENHWHDFVEYDTGE
jgi:hypothetical protein